MTHEFEWEDDMWVSIVRCGTEHIPLGQRIYLRVNGKPEACPQCNQRIRAVVHVVNVGAQESAGR